MTMTGMPNQGTYVFQWYVRTCSHSFQQLPTSSSFFSVCPLPTMSASPAGLHLQDLILDTKATASKEQKAEAVSLWSGGLAGRVQFSIAYACRLLSVIGKNSHDEPPLLLHVSFPGQTIRS